MRNLKKGIAAILSAALCMTSVPVTGMYTVMAADSTNLTAHYDMSHEGTSLKDVSGNGNDATLYNTEGTAFAEYNGEITMQFDNKEYATLPAGLLGANGDFTIQTVVSAPATGDNWVWCIGDGIGTWNADNISDYIFLSANSKQGSYANKAFGAIKVGSVKNGGESRMPVPANTLGAGYSAITMVSEGRTLTIYVDGEVHSTLTHAHNVADIIPNGNITGYIGQSLYSDDAKLIGSIADIKIWNTALSAEEVAAEVPGEDAEMAMIMADIVPTLLNGNASLDKIKSNVAFPSTINGIAMTWNVPANNVIAKNGTVTTPVGNNVQVTVTVSFTYGGEVQEQSYTLTVLGENADNLLQEAYDELDIPNKNNVRGNITLPEEIGNGVKVTWATDHPEIVDLEAHPASVAGYDEVPAGVVTRPATDTAVKMTATLNRDGNIMTKEFTLNVVAAPKKLEDSDYTDYFFPYFIGEGLPMGEQIYFSASRDGLHWTSLNDGQPVLVSTLGEKGLRDPHILRSPEGDTFYMISTDLKIYNGNGWDAAQNRGSQSLMVWESNDLVNWSNQRMVEVSADIGAGCTWAPETTYDPLTGEYVVYWASRTPAVDSKQRVYYAKTRDFYTFTTPEVFIDLNQSSIDSTIIYNDGTYYRYTKNEGGSRNQLNANSKSIFIQKSDTLLGEYTHIASSSLNSHTGVEGPAIFKFNQDDSNGDQWCLLLDNYGSGGYYPMLTTDLESGVFTQPDKAEYAMPSGARHGTPIRITAKEYAAIMSAYGDDPVEELMNMIDSFVLYDYSQAKAVADLRVSYEALSDEQKELMNQDKDYEAAIAAIEKAVAELEGTTSYIQDQSKNAFQIPFASTATFKKSGDEVVMSGVLPIPFNDVLTPVFSGNGTSFTVEVEVIPTGDIQYNMFAGKGDSAFALRTRPGNLDFHIYAGGSWRSIEYAMPASMSNSWLNNKHQVAGIYDASTNSISLYCDGQMVVNQKATNTTSGVASSNYNLTLGACPDTGRTSDAEFAAMRVYNKVLTAAELATQNTDAPAYAADDAAVELWIDFDTIEKEATPEPEPVFPFEDVKEGSWYYEAVYDNYFAGLMTGKDETTFAPKDALTRAEFALILYRIEGEPDVTSDKKFDDVSAGTWYTDAVLWAYEEGIITGYEGTNNFGPHDKIMREQMAVMMYRYAKTKDANITADADLSKFADVGKLGDYAVEAMKWAVGNGIITGKDEVTLDPRGNAIRAEAAVVIDRFANN